MSSLTAPTQAKILNGKDFLTMKESTPTAIADLLKLAQTIKAKLQAGIQTILVIGSGPIVIGQAAEFDYAGTQACLALKE